MRCRITLSPGLPARPFHPLLCRPPAHAVFLQAVDEIVRLKKDLRRATRKLHKYEKRAGARSGQAGPRRLPQHGPTAADSSNAGGYQYARRPPSSRESRGVGRQPSASPCGRYRTLKPSGRPTTPNPDNGGLTSQNDADESDSMSGSDDDELAQLSMMTLRDHALGVSQLGSPGDWASPGANNNDIASSARSRPETPETPANGQPRLRPQTPLNRVTTVHAGCTPAGKAASRPRNGSAYPTFSRT